MKPLFISKTDATDLHYQTVQYLKYQGIYGYLILTKDDAVLFVYSSDDSVQYDDITEDFVIIK